MKKQVVEANKTARDERAVAAALNAIVQALGNVTKAYGALTKAIRDAVAVGATAEEIRGAMKGKCARSLICRELVKAGLRTRKQRESLPVAAPGLGSLVVGTVDPVSHDGKPSPIIPSAVAKRMVKQAGSITKAIAKVQAILAILEGMK